MTCLAAQPLRSNNRSRSTPTIRSRTIASAACSEARRDDAGALAQFEMAIRNARACPAPILATAHLEAARLHERAGRVHEAISAYRAPPRCSAARKRRATPPTRALARLTKP